MDLGAFSVSLAVADMDKSRAFYEALGFEVVGGEAEQNWLILANGTTIIGLFHGMFEGNILTFNPGLDNHNKRLDEFTDVREIQRRLQAAGLELNETVDPAGQGAGHITFVDPDGNAVMIDQFD